MTDSPETAFNWKGRGLPTVCHKHIGSDRLGPIADYWRCLATTCEATSWKKWQLNWLCFFGGRITPFLWMALRSLGPVLLTTLPWKKRAGLVYSCPCNPVVYPIPVRSRTAHCCLLGHNLLIRTPMNGEESVSFWRPSTLSGVSSGWSTLKRHNFSFCFFVPAVLPQYHLTEQDRNPNVTLAKAEPPEPKWTRRTSTSTCCANLRIGFYDSGSWMSLHPFYGQMLLFLNYFVGNLTHFWLNLVVFFAKATIKKENWVYRLYCHLCIVALLKY